MLKKTLYLLALGATCISLQGCLGPAVVSAGVGAAMVSEDPRTAGTIVDDRVVVSKLSTRIKNKYPKKTNVTVTTYNHVVLLTGQVASADIKEDLVTMVLETQSVRDFKDETVVSELGGFKDKAIDTSIKSQIVALFAKSNDVRSIRIKTTVEQKTVYLMGLVSRDEGETAAQIAASVKNVAKVVKIFEYVD